MAKAMSQVSNSTGGGLLTPTSTLGAMDVDTPQPQLQLPSPTGITPQLKGILNPDSSSSQTTPPSTSPAATRPTTTADANSETTPLTKPKRRRITEEQFDILIGVFQKTDTPPYEVREELSKKLGMSTRDVQVWFQNRRAKVNREKQNAQNVVRHPNDAHFRNTRSRSRSQSDVGPSMGFQFVPIVSCDKAKNGAGPAMSQSLRGYRNPTPHYLHSHHSHPPPIAPNPHFTGSAHHHSHHYQAGGMVGTAPTSHRMPTPSPRVMRPASREGGAIRTRRGSHSVSSNLPPITVAPYAIPQSSSISAMSHSLSPIAPAFGAMSLSPSHSPVAVRTGRHHRPSPLNMTPAWSPSAASSSTHYYPAPLDSPMGYHIAEGPHPPSLTSSYPSAASHYPAVGPPPRFPTYPPNSEGIPYPPHPSSTSVLSGTMYSAGVGQESLMTDSSGMPKPRTLPSRGTSGMPRRATISHPMIDSSGILPIRNGGAPTLPPLSSIADHLPGPPPPHQRELGKGGLSPLSPPLTHRSTGSQLKNGQVGNVLSDSKIKGNGINMLASIAATIEHNKCELHQSRHTPDTPSKLPTPRTSVSGATAGGLPRFDMGRKSGSGISQTNKITLPPLPSGQPPPLTPTTPSLTGIPKSSDPMLYANAASPVISRLNESTSRRNTISGPCPTLPPLHLGSPNVTQQLLTPRSSR